MFFRQKKEELLLICDNGAHVRIPGKAPVYQCMPFSVVHAVLDLCQKLPSVVPVLCGVDGIYYPKAAKSQFEQEITNFYVQFSAIPYAELYTVTDPIIKIALRFREWFLNKSILLCRNRSGLNMKLSFPEMSGWI